MKDDIINNKAYIIDYVIVFIYTSIMIASIVMNFTQMITHSKEINIILIFLEAIISSLIENLIITIFFIGYIIASKKIYKSKLDETDFDKNKNLYRNIINNYNISTLNYIDSFKLDAKQSYTAKLLELQRKKIIKLEDNNIIVINEPKDEVDIAFINSINNNRITMPIFEYEKYCEKDAIRQELLTENKNESKKNNYIIAFIFLIILFVISSSVGMYLMFSVGNKNPDILPIMIVLYILATTIIVGAAIYVYAYGFAYATKKDKMKYIRTQKGKEINKQLDGLKNFMKTFGNMGDKKSNNLILWDDYLIYSVMFNQNKNIINEYSKFM